jgi:hypothetical protein
VGSHTRNSGTPELITHYTHTQTHNMYGT